jgi:hypothetical protein
MLWSLVQLHRRRRVGRLFMLSCRLQHSTSTPRPAYMEQKGRPYVESAGIHPLHQWFTGQIDPRVSIYRNTIIFHDLLLIFFENYTCL